MNTFGISAYRSNPGFSNACVARSSRIVTDRKLGSGREAVEAGRPASRGAGTAVSVRVILEALERRISA